MSRLITIPSFNPTKPPINGKKPNAVISNYRAKVLRLAQANARKANIMKDADNSLETPKANLDLTEPLKLHDNEDFASARSKKNILNTSDVVQGLSDNTKADPLFLKLPLHTLNDAASARTIKNPALASQRTRNNLETLVHKANAASKLLVRIASRKPSKADQAVDGTQALYGHIMHQLSRKGDVKISKENLQAGASPCEKIEVKYPINPGKALKLFLNQLSDFEKGEILDYKHIHFLGLDADKISGSALAPHNNGYDDERGDYKVVLKDHLAYRYEVLDVLGKGSFGQALKCFDYKKNEHVAVKIIRNKKRFHHQAVIEAKILKYIKENDPDDKANVIRMREFFIFRNHFCITFELLSLNLYEFIRNNNFRGVSVGLIRRFAIQILQALKYFRQHGIIHCDLKPENILLKQSNKSGIKVIDLGSSCFENERIYTYIQSRFYRAPEIMLGIPYTTSIDIWSFGCILAELFCGFPIFPGECEQEQLGLIMETLGIPPKYMLDMASRRKLFFDPKGNPILEANSRGKIHFPSTKNIAQKLRCSDKNFLNLLHRCLEWDPEKRITPEEALRHEWILEGLPTKVLAHHQKVNACPPKPVAEKLPIQRRSKKHISNLSQNVSFSNGESFGNNGGTVEKIVLNKPHELASGQNTFFIRLGRKRNNAIAHTGNNSLNVSRNVEDSIRVAANQLQPQPQQNKKPMLKIRLANNVLNSIKPKEVSVLPPLASEFVGLPKQFKVVKLVHPLFLTSK